MSEPLTPNPYSPYADADPNFRHLIPGMFTIFDHLGVGPEPGALCPALCGGMTVIPEEPLGDITDPIREGRTGDLPDGLCPVCMAVATGQHEPEGTPGTCGICAGGSSHGDLCALCRQELHDICRDPAALRDSITRSIAYAQQSGKEPKEIAGDILDTLAPVVKRLTDDLIGARQELTDVHHDLKLAVGDRYTTAGSAAIEVMRQLGDATQRATANERHGTGVQRALEVLRRYRDDRSILSPDAAQLLYEVGAALTNHDPKGERAVGAPAPDHCSFHSIPDPNCPGCASLARHATEATPDA